jgi:hypothetical protein
MERQIHKKYVDPPGPAPGFIFRVGTIYTLADLADVTACSAAAVGCLVTKNCIIYS